MILRVYAMYNKSKPILGLLLVFYVSEVVLFSISEAYYNNPNTYLTGTHQQLLSRNRTHFYYSAVTNPQVLNMSFCNPTYTIASQLGAYKYIPRLTLSALLLALAVGRYCYEAVQTYRVTKRWQVNRYINLLVREGVLYFLGYVPWALVFVLLSRPYSRPHWNGKQQTDINFC